MPRSSRSPSHGMFSASFSMRAWRSMYTGFERMRTKLSVSFDTVGA